MSSQSPNPNALDYLHLLKRRRVSFERWAQHEGISTQEAFTSWKETLESQGEFFVSQEFQELAKELPKTPAVPIPKEEPRERVKKDPPPKVIPLTSESSTTEELLPEKEEEEPAVEVAPPTKGTKRQKAR